MTRLEWGAAPALYTLGTDRAVLYTDDGAVPWNGLVSVGEKVTDTKSPVYLDGQRISDGPSINEDYAVSIGAFTYPEEFNKYDGFDDILDGQPVPRFDFSFRVGHGDGYRIHIVYNALANPTDKTWNTVNDAPSASLFTWDISTIPQEYDGIRPSAHVVIDSTVASSTVMDAVENALYGTGSTDPYLPTIEELVDLFEANSLMVVTDLGGGKWSASGPDSMVKDLGGGKFQITAVTAFYISSDRFQLSSA